MSTAYSRRPDRPAIRDTSAPTGAPSDPAPDTAGRRRWAGPPRLALFLLLAFGLSWLPWPLVLLNPASSPMVPFGPLVAAVITTAVSGGVRGVARLLGQLRTWRAAPRLYLAALLVPTLLTGTAALITLVIDGTVAHPPPVDWAQAATVFTATLILVGLFEELGWRGYAFPALQRRWGNLIAALVLGVVWVLWHLPLLLSEPSRQRPVVPFILMVIAQSMFFGWLYTGSRAGLSLVILSHAVVDTVARYTLPIFDDSSYQLVWWSQTALWILVGLVTASQLRRSAPSETA